MRASAYDRHPTPGRRPQPFRNASRALLAPVRRLVRLNPLQSWLIVMAVIVGLSVIGLRTIALLLAVGWTVFAISTWISPSMRQRLRR